MSSARVSQDIWIALNSMKFFRLFAVNRIGMIQRRGILHGNRFVQLSTVKAFQKNVFWFHFSKPPEDSPISSVVELTEIVVEQLDVEQVVHANNSPLNIDGLREGVDREGDLSSCQHREILLFMRCLRPSEVVF